MSPKEIADWFVVTVWREMGIGLTEEKRDLLEATIEQEMDTLKAELAHWNHECGRLADELHEAKVENVKLREVYKHNTEVAEQEIAELKAQLDAASAIIEGAPWYKDIEILQREKQELREALEQLKRPGFYCPHCDCSECEAKE